MAAVYVDSAVSSSGDGSTHTAAFKTLAEGLAAVSPGGKVLINKTHAEASSSAAVTLTSPGTSQPTAVQILSVDFANGDADAPGASVTASGQILYLSGFVRSYGVSFAGSQILYQNTATAWKIDVGSLSASGAIGAGTTSVQNSSLDLRNASLKFSAAGQGISLTGVAFSWRGGALQNAALTNLISSPNARQVSAVVEGVDLSIMAASGKLATLTTMGAQLLFKECLLPAGMAGQAVATGSLVAGCRVSVVRCSNTAGTFVDEVYAFEGSEIDATNVYRAGGTDDGVSGGVPRSRKLVTSANALPASPFTSSDIQILCDTAGSPVTVTFYGIMAGSVAPTNADIWLEAEYLQNAGNPLGGYAPGGRLATPQAAPSTYLVGSMAWTGAANVGSPATPFEMALNFTPAQKGPITLRIKAAKAGATFFYDSKPGVSIGGSALTISRSYVGPSGVTIHETGAVQTVTVDRAVSVAGRRFTF